MDPSPVARQEEAALVAQAATGERRATEALYRLHGSAVYTYALRCTRGRVHLAEEITQETFVRAFRALPRFDGRSALRTWLLAIAINVTRTQLKRAARHEEHTVPVEDAELAAAEVAPRDGFSAAHVRRALGELPAGYRDALVMHDVLEMEHEEIAAVRGCSVGTSKSQLHKARAKLRELLRPVLGGGHEPAALPR